MHKFPLRIQPGRHSMHYVLVHLKQFDVQLTQNTGGGAG